MKKEIITFKEPKSPISEIFRTLRTNIQFMNTKRGLKSILITSTSPSEGKSWVSANLAVAFAQAGKSVILVDADMRKGRQFSIFGIPPTPGLSNYLSGIGSDGKESSANLSSYVRRTEVENLYIVPAGNVPPNPSELLVSDQMLIAMEGLKQLCDLVIFDGTPSDLVTDAIILSRYVDTTLIITSHKQTKIDGLKKIKKDIENVGGKIAGVVINKMPTNQKEYYSTYYYYGNSSSSYKKTLPKKEIEKANIERRKEENRIKAREILKQNREYDENKQEEEIITNQTSTIYDYEKEETKENEGFKNAKELLEQMNNYVAEEKGKLKKEE